MTFTSRTGGRVTSPKMSRATLVGVWSPETRRLDPPPSDASFAITPDSKLLPRATAWTVTGFAASAYASPSRTAAACGLASTVPATPSPK